MIRNRCCGADCWAEHWLEEYGGPCWGDVEVIDEEYTDDDYWWIHACEGHANGYGGPYIPEPKP